MTTQEERLYQDVLTKIESEWPSKWQESQGNFSEEFNINSKNAFYSSLKEQVQNTDISVDSIRRFLLKEENKRGFKQPTLDFFAQYLGFKNWEHYQNPSFSHNRGLPLKWFIPVSASLVLLGAIIGYWKYQQCIKNEFMFTQLIKDANRVQLRCYQKLPQYDTLGLANYFLVDSIAYKDIEKVLIRNSTARRWTLNTHRNPSDYIFFDMKINSLTDSTATIRVKEFWHLQYFDADTGKEVYTYKSLSPYACYFFRKVEGKWKIENCLYEHDLVQNIGGQLKVDRINATVCTCE